MRLILQLGILGALIICVTCAIISGQYSADYYSPSGSKISFDIDPMEIFSRMIPMKISVDGEADVTARFISPDVYQVDTLIPGEDPVPFLAHGMVDTVIPPPTEGSSLMIYRGKRVIMQLSSEKRFHVSIGVAAQKAVETLGNILFALFLGSFLPELRRFISKQFLSPVIKRKRGVPNS